MIDTCEWSEYDEHEPGPATINSLYQQGFYSDIVVPVDVARQLQTERDELIARIEDQIEKVARKKELASSNYDRVCADLLDGCLRSLLVSEHRETRELFPGTLEALNDLVDGCFAPGATKITEEISTSGEGVN